MSLMDPYQRAIVRMFDPRTIVPFLVASLALGIISNVLLDLFKAWFGSDPTMLQAILGVSLGILFGMVVIIRWTIQWRPTTELNLTHHVPPALSRGLVFMISKDRKAPCLQAFHHHRTRLERMWLICSKESESTAKTLGEELTGLKAELVVELLLVEDVYDPGPFYEAVRKLYSKLPNGWTKDEVTCDFTGMTANASVGMSLACVKYDLPLEYTPPKTDGDKIVGSLPPICINLPVKNTSRSSSRSKTVL